MFIPSGFAKVTPYIFTDDADRYMDHLCTALDGVEVGRTLQEDGKVANGQIRFGDASIMISEAGRGFSPSQSTFYLYVEDADNAMRRAITAGMKKIMEVADMSYGDRQGGVKDIAGNIWWLSQRLSVAPYY